MKVEIPNERPEVIMLDEALHKIYAQKKGFLVSVYNKKAAIFYHYAASNECFAIDTTGSISYKTVGYWGNLKSKLVDSWDRMKKDNVTIYYFNNLQEFAQAIIENNWN